VKRRALVVATLAACSTSTPTPLPTPTPKPPPKSLVALGEKPKPPAPPKRVVIISEDGMRPDVLTEALAPNHVALAKQGAIAQHAETIQESDTLPSHASMLSGVGASAHGLWWNHYQADRGFIHVPTIFSAAHAAHLTTAMIVGKPKLKHIASPGTVDHFERPSYLCGGVAKRAAEYIASDHPDLLFVHFSDPDEYGHSHGWMSKEYLHAVHNSDACLATVLAAIDPATTLVIVTADHGGHGTKHSDGHVAVDRDIPWIIRGPGIAPGSVLDHEVETVDTAATTLAALGLPALPHMVGATRVTFTR
jgi:predicted AlkP superfamily pyrophosphatase or phosphodiesterase